MENKKGNIVYIILMIGILFLVLLMGLFLVFGGMIIDWTFDEAVPELTGIGMMGNANITQITQTTIAPVNTLVQNFTWLTGFIYILALIGCFGLAFAFKMTGNKWLMGFFIACMFLLIVASIFISNIYEEFYNDGTDVGDLLHEYTLLSWLILYSPMVMTIIGFTCGVIMFSGEGEPYYG